MTVDLQAAFEACLDRLLRGEATLDQCLDAYPGLRDELHPLLVVGVDLQRLPLAPMSQAERDRGQALVELALALRAVGRAAGSRVSWRQPWTVLRRLPSFRLAGAAATLVAALAVFGGVTLAAVNSGPESALYGYRLSLEEFRIALAPEEDRPQLFMANADARVREIEATVAEGNPEGTVRATQSYQESVRAG